MLELVFVFSCWILNRIFSHRITSVNCSSRPGGTVDVLIYKPQKKSRGGGLAQKETRGVRPGPTWEETGSIWQCQDMWVSVVFSEEWWIDFYNFCTSIIGLKICCGCGWLRIGTEWWAIHNFKLWHFGMCFVDASKLWTKIIKIKHNETPWQWFRKYRKPMFLFFFRWRWQVTLESKDVSVRTGHDLEAIIEATKHSRLTWWPLPALLRVPVPPPSGKVGFVKGLFNI